MDDLEKWKALGSYIRSVRKEKKITMYAIEKKYGISRQYWSRVELGNQGYFPKPDLLQQMASILSINYLDLYEVAGYCDDLSIKEYYERKNLQDLKTNTFE